jgi:hypothetical protein
MRVKVCHRWIQFGFLHVEGSRKFTSTPLGFGVAEVFGRVKGLSLSLLILLSLASCYYALALFFFQIQMREKNGLWSIQKTFKPCFLFYAATD